MSTETLEQLMAIRDGKPEGATHVERVISRGVIYFLKRVNRYGVYTYDIYSNEHGSYIDGGTISGDVRSLKDIELIIELMERNQYLAEMIKYGVGEQDLQKDI